ncbi:hypothetical protein [Cellulomonas aerilata]|uniref:hypothetical protein n=1 Tax=Cellulomonas aerilata TaxID=515326 RepID=UPI0016497A90|nr:hypothetical protein [Cellulomonas aerilata]
MVDAGTRVGAGPTTYTIRVDGHLDDHWSSRLGEPDLTREVDGTTTLTVAVADQAQLHGVLAGLRDIGAVLTELRVTGVRVTEAEITEAEVAEARATRATTDAAPWTTSSRPGCPGYATPADERPDD